MPDAQRVLAPRPHTAGAFDSIPDQNVQKRPALNALWNAAGTYDIEPADWQIFRTGDSGRPGGIPLEVVHTADVASWTRAERDSAARLYRNTASGLMWKWFDGPAICEFAASWESDFRAAALDELCWLAFAEAAFERERDMRPALVELHETFLATLTPQEREIVARIDRAACSQAELERQVRSLAREFLRFDGHCIETPDEHLHLGVSLLGLALRDSAESADRRKLKIHTATGDTTVRIARRAPLAITRLLDERAARTAERNRAYIERCFGPLLCTPTELEDLERVACTGAHANCRLWIADGSRLPGDLTGREFRTMQVDAAEQLARNRAFLAAGRRAFEATIEKLARSLGDRLHSSTRVAERGHNNGMLDPRRAWRAAALGDTAVFQKRVPIDAPDVKVDLLLDASGSRNDQQEAIATQAYVLGSALARCRIPVRISAFSSLRDHTIIRVFCGHGDTNGIGNVMHYFAAGMNRDGLALRAMGELMRDPADSCKRLLLVLTDGSPMDDHAMPGNTRGKHQGDYLGKPAIRDTAAEVRALRHVGIHVAAVYQGPDDYVDHARLIYGTHLVRTQRIERMAEMAALLIATALDE